jgi:hypothetical protein
MPLMYTENRIECVQRQSLVWHNREYHHFHSGSHQTNTDLEFSVPQKVYHKLQYVARNIHPDELKNQTFMPYLIKSLRNCIDHSIDWLIPGLDSNINLCLWFNKIFKKTNIVTLTLTLTNIVTWLINTDNYQINYHIPESMLILKNDTSMRPKRISISLFCPFTLRSRSWWSSRDVVCFASYFLTNLYNFPYYNQFLLFGLQCSHLHAANVTNSETTVFYCNCWYIGESLEIGAIWNILVNEKL